MGAYYEFCCPTKILCGRKALSNLPHELTGLGAKRPMILTDKGVEAAGLLAKVQAAFVDCKMEIGQIFTDVPVDSSNRVVNRIARLFKDTGCDSLVAVGGGSVIDTAKGVNIVLAQETEDLLNFQGVDRLTGTMKPFITIPTTSGTGSEVTNVAVILNEETHAKMAFVSGKLFSHVTLLDPAMLVTMPPKITASTGMDALTHAIEAYTCLQKNPMSDAMALAGIRKIVENLAAAVKNGKDENARINMADGALMAGAAFSNSMVGMVHAIAHSVGAASRVAHGVANSILLPYGMEYNVGKAASELSELAPLLYKGDLTGLDTKARALKAVEGVRALTAELNRLCGLPLRLSEAGVKAEQLEQIAKLSVNDGALTYNPEEMTWEEGLEVLKKAF
ncbi:MAG: iron-containing alcohol dehydrogenase [Myxococcota bacterium]|jgi:alcohol dehydrogenase